MADMTEILRKVQMSLAATLCLLLLPPLAMSAEQPDPRDIIRQMESVMRGDSSRAEMTMTIERPRYTRDISLRFWALGEDFSLALVTAPARDQGTVFLKRRNEIWNYVPNIDRTIKMPPSMMSQSWMGSDFTNDDLVRETSLVDDYEHRLLREEEYDGRDTWVIEMIPNPEAAVVWGKVLVWVDQQEYLQLRVENYDQNDELANTLTFSDIRQVGDRAIPMRMVLTPADRPDQRTVLVYNDLEFDIDISESFFTQQNMRRVR